MLTLAVCVVYEVCVIVALHVMSDEIASLFTKDIETIQLIKDCLPTLSCLVLFDGFCGAQTGIVRALGKQGIVSLMFLLFYYLVALPIAAFLGFVLGWGLSGFWAGFIVALALLNVVVARICIKAEWVAEYILQEAGPGTELLPLISK